MLKPFLWNSILWSRYKVQEAKRFKETDQVFFDQMYYFSLYPKELQYKKDNYTETDAINSRNMRKIKSKPCVLTMEHVKNYPEKLAKILKVKTFQQVALFLGTKYK